MMHSYPPAGWTVRQLGISHRHHSCHQSIPGHVPMAADATYSDISYICLHLYSLV